MIPVQHHTRADCEIRPKFLDDVIDTRSLSRWNCLIQELWAFMGGRYIYWNHLPGWALNVLIMFSEKIYILAGTSVARDGLSFFDSHAFFGPNKAQ